MPENQVAPPPSETEKLKAQIVELQEELKRTQHMLIVAVHRAGGALAVHKGQLSGLLRMPMELRFYNADPLFCVTMEPKELDEPIIQRASSVPLMRGQ